MLDIVLNLLDFVCKFFSSLFHSLNIFFSLFYLPNVLNNLKKINKCRLNISFIFITRKETTRYFSNAQKQTIHQFIKLTQTNSLFIVNWGRQINKKSIIINFNQYSHKMDTIFKNSEKIKTSYSLHLSFYLILLIKWNCKLLKKCCFLKS